MRDGFNGIDDRIDAKLDCATIGLTNTVQNLYDGTYVSGFIDPASGDIRDSDTYITSNFIKVTPGKYFFLQRATAIQQMRFIALFKSDKSNIWMNTTIEGDDTAVNTNYKLIPDNCFYVRFTIRTSNNYDIIAIQNDTVELVANSVQTISKDLLPKIDIDDLVNVVFSYKNLYNPEAAVYGYIAPLNGYIADSNNYKTSDFIPVIGGMNIICSVNGELFKSRFIAQFDSNKQIITHDNSEYSYLSVCKLDDNTAYVRVTFYLNENTMLELSDGVQPSAYVPYGDLKIMSKYLPESTIKDDSISPFYGKKVAWIGSSITQGYGWCKKVDDYFNFNATNCGVGGTAMCYESVSSMCTIERLKGEYENVTDPNTGEITATGKAIPEDVDIIFVEAGTNDWARNWPLGEREFTFNDSGELELNNKTFYGACHLFFKHATELFPNAIIIAVGTPFGKMPDRGSFNNKYGVINNQGLSSVDYGDALVDAAGLWGLYGFNFGRLMGIHDNNITELLPDGLHLSTEQSQSNAANAIINELLKIKFI